MEPSIKNTKIFSVKLKGKCSDTYAFRRKLKKGKNCILTLPNFAVFHIGEYDFTKNISAP